MKILVVRFSSIGDIVLTTPVVRCLKQQTGAEIHFLTKKSFAHLMANNPYVDKVWALQGRLGDLVPALRAEDFDLIVDLHKNWRTLQLRLSLGIKTLTFNKLNIEKWLFVRFKKPTLPRVHIVDRYLNTVATLGVVNDGKGLDFFIPESDKVAAHTVARVPYVAFVIGAAHATKRLPVSQIIAICQLIEQPIVLLGGPDDVPQARDIEAACPTVVNLCGKLSLNQSASVVAQAAQVITHDTGLMHIAAAFHKKIISIWGNTVPAFGMTAYTEGVVNIEVPHLSCRPCSKIGHAACPKGHFRCMNDIDPAAVAAAVRHNAQN